MDGATQIKVSFLAENQLTTGFRAALPLLVVDEEGKSLRAALAAWCLYHQEYPSPLLPPFLLRRV